MVTYPYCGPCARMHQKLEDLLIQYGDSLRNYKTDDSVATKQFIGKRNQAIKVLSGVYLKYGMENSIPIYLLIVKLLKLNKFYLITTNGVNWIILNQLLHNMLTDMNYQIGTRLMT